MAAGVLGLQGILGAVFFAIVTIALGGAIYGLRLQNGFKAYLRHWSDPFTEGMSQGLFVRFLLIIVV
jgi:hypothetical protein